MATNTAVKRARKAQRRKEIQAERRKQEAFENSLAGQVQRAAGRPILHCLLNESLSRSGMGTLVLVRGSTPYGLTMAAFLIDTLGRGVKDVFVRSLDADEFELYLETLNRVDPMSAVEPALARKLLREVTAWARTAFGAVPHRDFAVAERMFGDVNADDCSVNFGFGDRAAQADGPKQIAGPRAA
jgi:hypothetical protein